MAREMLRQGGRSARIQEAVHRTVQELLKRMDRSGITVPMIAEKAGVTPSTIYRRWGDLSELLADVAVARMRPIADPEDTGAMASDLETFMVQYAEEMSSKVGRAMMSDVLASTEGEAAARCCQYTYHHLETLRERAAARGETPFDINEAVDLVVAPIVYHILFRDREPTPDYCRSLVGRFLGSRAEFSRLV
ncbi:TetR/AcrR family transcriptional regulator C-terminal ligand-binding domain-containing protein [Neorhizobium sp. CSC1952]|uniref:TetR/AcrR family transcriptional regulator C-terminal ligand-binding domain-containing protein n=1 Tax=Neorhizobium sp. CSC1952 TaxID=2978974 RepID=UPI0025A4E218|nr:TetR/AcrR family transcriptional regulator C-terminal ligand-binding domain-containing protein [Rhizobium sp. CSC1952]WJR67608.1 TetR/AcrR family transcriptional regulator C-terminal ligand-binding domain-containing protein [Rhizobium sp. CSC1952]